MASSLSTIRTCNRRFRLVGPFVLCFFLLAGNLRAQTQDDPNDVPLGDVARSLRNRNLQRAQGADPEIIDNDNLPQVMHKAPSRNSDDSALKFLMAGESKIFHVSARDVTCSLAFSANTKALLSGSYSQMDLPAGELSKLHGPATVEGDALTVTVFNGTDWHLSEVTVALTIIQKPGFSGAEDSVVSQVRPEKNPDLAVLYKMRAAAPPDSTTVFSAPLNLELAPGQEWHWALVQAKGYPPESYDPRSAQTATSAPPASWDAALQPSAQSDLPPLSSPALGEKQSH